MSSEHAMSQESAMMASPKIVHHIPLHVRDSRSMPLHYPLVRSYFDLILSYDESTDGKLVPFVSCMFESLLSDCDRADFDSFITKQEEMSVGVHILYLLNTSMGVCQSDLLEIRAEMVRIGIERE